MTADHTTRTPDGTIMLPLRAAHGRYRHFSEGYTPRGSPRAQAAWRTLLERSSDRVQRTAEIAGRLYRTQLFVHRDAPEVAYAELDQRFVPVDVPDDPPIPPAYGAYADYLRDECKFSEPLTKDTRVSLTGAFIPPRFKFLDPDDGETISWKQLHDHARVVVIGGPGEGKTSSLRRLILELLATDQQTPFGSPVPPDTLPVLIRLRDFPVEDLGPAMIRRLINAERADELLPEFRPPLEGRRLLLAIDGLDELTTPEKQMIFLDRLEGLCQEVPLMRVVLTSRDPVPDDALGDFTRVQLLPFDSPAIQQWTLFYLSSHDPGQSRWSEFMDLVRYDSQLGELVGNPLLLGLASSQHWRSPDELNNRVGLLSKCVEVLVQDWDASRGIARWRDSYITPGQIKRLLNRLSFHLMKERRNEFTSHDVSTMVSGVTGFREEDPGILLAACRTSGLIRNRNAGEDVYVFVHRALADYFAASDMVSRTSDVAEAIRDLSSEEDGRLFWRLTCSLASNADELLAAAYKHGKDNTKPGDERAAAFMLAQALGEEISASPGVISNCADLVVAALENRLRDAEPLDESVARTNWPRRADRRIVWAGGAVAAAGNNVTAELSTSARLMELIYRARTGTAATALCDRMADSKVPLVRHAAEALGHRGWCEHTLTAEGGRTVLYVAVTRAAESHEAS